MLSSFCTLRVNDSQTICIFIYSFNRCFSSKKLCPEFISTTYASADFLWCVVCQQMFWYLRCHLWYTFSSVVASVFPMPLPVWCSLFTQTVYLAKLPTLSVSLKKKKESYTKNLLCSLLYLNHLILNMKYENSKV